MATATRKDYPKKLFYKIQEVANIVGVEPYVLRYWETKFPMLSPDKDGADQRRYRQKDIDLLLRIRSLLYDEKYTIAGAVARLKDEKSGKLSPGSPPSNGAGAAVSQTDFIDDEAPGGAIAFDGDSVTAYEDALDNPELSEDQREKLQRIRDELGLLKRELETWRDELEG